MRAFILASTAHKDVRLEAQMEPQGERQKASTQVAVASKAGKIGREGKSLGREYLLVALWPGQGGNPRPLDS